jgi:hypothetical protein
MSRKDIEQRIEELEASTPDATALWVAELSSQLPNRERSALTVESVQNGQRVFENPDKVVLEAEGLMETSEGANLPEPPEHYTYVATGPKGVSSDLVHKWQLYADLDVHTPPEAVDTSQLPIKITLAHGSAFR